MKSATFLSFLLLISVSIAIAKESIAVLDIEIIEGVPKTHKSILSNRLRTELFKTQKFIVMEREKMEEVVGERWFQYEFCTSSDCARELGSLLGVEYIIASSIGKIGNTYAINVRKINVKTGEITENENEDIKFNIDLVLTKGIANVANKLVGNPPPFDYTWDEEYLPDFWGIGSTMDEVRKIQGEPAKYSEVGWKTRKYMWTYYFYPSNSSDSLEAKVYFNKETGRVEEINDVGGMLNVKRK